MLTWRCTATGLTSLQYRDAKGATTHEMQSNISAPHAAAHRKARRLHLRVSRGADGEPLQPSGASDQGSAAGTVLRGHRRLLAR